MYKSISSMTEDPYTGSLSTFMIENIEPFHTFKINSENDRKEVFVSIHACATTYAALTSTGVVYTYGETIHNSLGRRVEMNSSPWDIVTALEGIKIIKLASNAGGWMQAALAEDGSVYMWGGYGNECIHGLPSRNNADEIGLIDLISEGETDGLSVEAKDVALGISHACILQDDARTLWVAGSADCGELGYGVETRRSFVYNEENEQKRKSCGLWRPWTRDILQLSDINASEIVQVVCGTNNTLVVVANKI